MARPSRQQRPHPEYYRKTRTTFEPRFTLSILYLFGFFFVYCLLLVSPALWEVLRSVPTGPEQEEAARIAAQAAIQPRLWIAVVAAASTTILGAHFRVLPGMRSRR
jgi:hypothetical protein